jgi:hypothetical protein
MMTHDQQRISMRRLPETLQREPQLKRKQTENDVKQ